jgi:multiple sugar transport system permease protein/raffinose/stachyose/melibiose transport system permease protein
MVLMPRILRATIAASLSLFTLLWSGPVLWMAILSLRTTQEFYRNPYGLPIPVHWEKFPLAWFQLQTYFRNSVIVSLSAALLVAAVGSMAAFFFARYRFPLKEPLYLLIFAAVMLPPQIMLIGLFQTIVSYGLYGGFLGLIPIYAVSHLPVTMYILRVFFAQIPRDLEDAARIDGASDWRMYWQVMMPIARPALIAISILNLIEFSNEFLQALVLITREDRRTLPLGLLYYMGDHHEDVAMLATGLMIAILPIFLLYALFSKRITESMTAGAAIG